MSRIDDLIAELCPHGVPIRPLGEVGTFVRGRRFTKADRVDEGLPSIHYGEIYTHYGVAATETISHVRLDLAPTLGFAEPDDVIIAAVGETVEDVGKALAWLGTNQVAVHDDCFIFRSPLDPKYVVYFMQSDAFNGPKEAFVARAKVKRLSKDGLAKLRIPVPPLQVQHEIVRVLDDFSGLEAELEVELEGELRARQLQYAHYRERLLTFGSGVQRLPMSELTHRIASGRNKSRSSEGGYPVYGSTGLIGYTDQPTYSGDAVLVARVGANAGLVNAVSGDYDVSDNTLVISLRTGWNIRFAFHQLTSMNINQYAFGGGQPLVTGGLLKNLEVAVPPLDEQERIAETLDRLNLLMKDVSNGLATERDARRKQFEHYRDRLLTFKELAA